MKQNSETPETLAQEPAPVTNSFKLAGDVYEALREAAFKRRTSQQQIVDEALRAYLKVSAS